MSRENFLERWSRLKKVAATTPAASELPDPATLLLNLGPDSDFSVFLRAEVSEDIRRQAMKQLFADPHFNVMDGLDTYIDDYSVCETIPEAMLAGLRQLQVLDDAAAGEAVEVAQGEAPATVGRCDILAGDGQIDPVAPPDGPVVDKESMT